MLDGISWALIVFNMLFAGYFATGGAAINVKIAIKGLLMLVLTVAGLAGYMAFFGKPKTDNYLSSYEIAVVTSSTVLGLFAVAFVQVIALQGGQLFGAVLAGLALWSAVLLVSIIAISEEVFFRFFIQSALEKRALNTTGDRLKAILTSVFLTSLVWTIFHRIVYTGAPEVLLAIFLSGIVLGLVYSYTRRLSVVMLIHVSANIMAVSVGGATVQGVVQQVLRMML